MYVNDERLIIDVMGNKHAHNKCCHIKISALFRNAVVELIVLDKSYYIGEFDNLSYYAILGDDDELLAIKCFGDTINKIQLTTLYYCKVNMLVCNEDNTMTYIIKILNNNLNIKKVFVENTEFCELLMNDKYVIEIHINNIFVHDKSTNKIIYVISYDKSDEVINDNYSYEYIDYDDDYYYKMRSCTDDLVKKTKNYYSTCKLISNMSLNSNVFTYYTKRKEYIIQRNCDLTTLRTTSLILTKVKKSIKRIFVL